MDTSIFNEGLKLMAFGMGNVFLFLILMVIIITITSKVLAPFAHLLEEPAKPKAKRKVSNKKPESKDDKAMVSAIIAAVHQFRQDNK